MRSKRNGSKDLIPCEGIDEYLSIEFGANKMRNSCLELGLDFGVVKYPQGADCNIINNFLIEAKKDRLTLVNQDLRDIFIHNNRALDYIRG